MKTYLRPVIVGSALLALSVQAAYAAKTDDRPLIPLLKAEEVQSYCADKISALKQRVATLENQQKQHPVKPGDTKLVFSNWNQLQIALEDLQGPSDIISNVSPDDKVRSGAEACLIEVSKFSTDLYQNETLYSQFKTVQTHNPVDAKLRKDVMETFEDAGVALSPEKRKRMKEILERLDVLSQDFARNIRDNNQKLSFSANEVKGMSEAYLAKAKRDDQGNYLLGFNYPEYRPFMDYADNADARKRYQIAFSNHGTPKNLEILKEAIDLRKEMAGLFGLPSYADFVIRRRMASTPDAVYKFLAEVQTAVTAPEKKDIEELRAEKAKLLNQPLADTKVERWDEAYLQQKIKQERFQVDQEALRKYFPTDAALPWILHTSGLLYGIEFKAVDVPVWHTDVKYYDVIDTKTKQRIGGIYLDLFPREGKYGHAAAWGVRGSSTLAKRTPYSVLVTNFNRQGLNSDELETLVHEFGHVLHGVLSNTRYVSQAGTSVERDFVEAPSQMYEEWARSKESLSQISNFCTSPCPSLSDEQLQQMNAAHNFARGMRYGRQLLYASYDMVLHNATPGDPLTIWDNMEAATPLGHTPGTEFPGQFGHLMGGYAAGYYGYMWSEVLALDLLSRYDGKLLNPTVGHQYRQAILSRGSEQTGAELVRNFLGREPNSKAFFDEINGQRVK